jgi:hypothetical protein
LQLPQVINQKQKLMNHFIVEQWKEFVPEFVMVRRYKISNLGRIKSFNQNLEDERLLKGTKCDGYPYLVLNGKKENKPVKKSISIHLLIGLLFIPKETEEKKHVLHLDYSRINNVITNLQWATYDEMIAHGKKSPHVIEAKKKLIAFNKNNDGRKLTVNTVRRLKKKLLDPNRKTRYKILAKQFGVSEMQLHRIKTGENWGHIIV